MNVVGEACGADLIDAALRGAGHEEVIPFREAREELFERQLFEGRLLALQEELGAAALGEQTAGGGGGEDLLALGSEDVERPPAFAVEEELNAHVLIAGIEFDDHPGVFERNGFRLRDGCRRLWGEKHRDQRDRRDERGACHTPVTGELRSLQGFGHDESSLSTRRRASPLSASPSLDARKAPILRAAGNRRLGT